MGHVSLNAGSLLGAAESGLQVTVNKETETSILQQQETEFCQQSKSLETESYPEPPDENSVWLTPGFQP